MTAQPMWSPGDDELDALARGLPALERTAERTEQGRANLLASAATLAQQPRPSRTPWIAGVAAMVAAAAILVVWLVARPGNAPAAKESITPIGVAQFGRASGWPDFVVRVDDGKVAIEVAALADGERFRAKTADAEVEVRGTKFVVGAERGRLTSVAVSEGRVEVRWAHAPPVFLSAGETWAPVQTARRDAVEPPNPTAPTSAATTGAGSTTAITTPPTEAPAGATTATANEPTPATTANGPATRTLKVPVNATTTGPTTATTKATTGTTAARTSATTGMTKTPATTTTGTTAAKTSAMTGAAKTPATTGAANTPATTTTGTTAAKTSATTGMTKTPATTTTGTTGAAKAPEITTTGTTGAANTPAIASVPTPPTTKPAVAASPGESDFRAGVTSLRGGDASAATRSFAAACQAAQRDALGEDACFWVGAAARRAGQTATARDALTKFLAEYPRSGRAGEAAALLGWILYEAGQLDAAEQRFTQAARDRVPQVRDSATKGLEAIKRTRAGGK